MKKQIESSKEPELERCVLCGKLTCVSKATPVGKRKGYLMGAGQLCEECCWQLYGTDDLRELQL